MKLTGALFSIALASFTSALAGESAPPAAEKSMRELVADLSSGEFQIREQATRRLWEAGTAALDALRSAADGEDPEASFRARDILRKIELHITPDTDPAIIDLAERYSRARKHQKPDLLSELRDKRAWRQVLLFNASETDPELRENLRRIVDGVAVLAARERILANDPKGAKAFLELAPADPQGLVSLAAFHRSQGTLGEELEKVETSTAPGNAAWKLALHRAAGNPAAAREAAGEAGEKRLANLMAVFSGDPLPWIHQSALEHHTDPNHVLYANLAARRWQGKAVKPADLEPLVDLLDSDGDGNPWLATNLLCLLGRPDLVEDSVTERDPLYAYSYFDSLERIPEALQALGLDPETPDFKSRLTGWFEDYAGDPEDSGDAEMKLLELISFMDRRGFQQEIIEALSDPALLLAEEDPERFATFLDNLCGRQIPPAPKQIPSFARHLAASWAGEDVRRWQEILLSFFGGDAEVEACWDWLSELQPEITWPERLDVMSALLGTDADPGNLRSHWLDLIWKTIETSPENARPDLYRRLAYITRTSIDVETTLKLIETTPDDPSSDHLLIRRPLYFSASGRWGEAADLFLEMIGFSDHPRPELHAQAASCLRRAGRAREAAAQDEWVEKLALGDILSNSRIAIGYAFGGDAANTAKWWRRAALESPPDSSMLRGILPFWFKGLFEAGEWSQAAAIAEIVALSQANVSYRETSLVPFLRLRFEADLSRALSLAGSDRKQALSLLAACHAMMPTDGSLADYFFPALRKAGFHKEHDQWFEETWSRIARVVGKYPASDNTLNTAGWLASRAARRLDEAEELLKAALAVRPSNPAYLDTMAEIHFARRDRKAAARWSLRSLNFNPVDSMIRAQHFRFLDAPFPE